MWSTYNHNNTAKINVTGHGAGFFVHISDPYVGSISDDDLISLCKVMEQLPAGSRLLLDKGYRTALSDAYELVSYSIVEVKSFLAHANSIAPISSSEHIGSYPTA